MRTARRQPAGGTGIQSEVSGWCVSLFDIFTWVCGSCRYLYYAYAALFRRASCFFRHYMKSGQLDILPALVKYQILSGAGKKPGLQA
jgi:hypothetical protein